MFWLMLHLGLWMKKWALDSQFGLMALWFMQVACWAPCLISKRSWVKGHFFPTAKEAKAHRFHKLHVSSNALALIQAINGSLDWTIHSILTDIKEIYADLEVIFFDHISRSLYGFTHNLAKNSCKMGNFVDWGWSWLLFPGGFCFVVPFSLLLLLVLCLMKVHFYKRKKDRERKKKKNQKRNYLRRRIIHWSRCLVDSTSH